MRCVFLSLSVHNRYAVMLLNVLYRKDYMKLCCVINFLPRPVRLTIGVLFWLLGLPVLISPVPVGLVMILTGTLLILGASEPRKHKIRIQAEPHPRLYKFVRPFVERCENCRGA